MDPEDTTNHSESAKPLTNVNPKKVLKFSLASVNHVGLPKKFLSYMTLLNLSLRSRILLAAISKGGKGLAASWK